METPPIIDPHAIENLRSLNPGDNDAFLREIAGIFFEDTPKRIADLDRSLAQNDVAFFNRAAHSIKGSSSNLGAFVLRAVAERLEIRSRQNGLSDIEPMLAELKTEYQRAETEIRRLLNL